MSLRTCDCGKVAIDGGFGPLNAAGATKGVRVWTWPPKRIVRRWWWPSRVVQEPAYKVWHHPSGCLTEGET